MDVLTITTIGHAVSAIVILLAGILVLGQGPKRTLNRAFFFSCLFTFLFGISLAVGINLPPSPTAYWVWFINIIDVFIVAAFLHFTFAVLRKEYEARWIIRTVYIIAGIIFVAALLFPAAFIPEISAKLFTKSYLSAGPIYVAMFVFFVSVFFLSFMMLISAYLSQKENRTQLEYFILATILGYGIGPIDFFLVFDIPVSPLYGMFFGLYMVPIAYGILAEHIMDVRFVIKRTFFYSLIVAIIAALLSLLTFLNSALIQTVPWLQFWMIPIVTALISFGLGRLFWLKSVENDRIKYEFITVAAHKLRTPLTRINWTVRELIDANPDPKTLVAAERILKDSDRLIELTNIIFDSTQNEADVTYFKEQVGLVAITKEIFEHHQSAIQEKKLVTSIHVDDEVFVHADKRRITAAIEVLIENAIQYTPEGGFVQVIAYIKNKKAYYSVRDSGIGVSQDEKLRIFSRFYRTDAAKRIDVEGVGLGLAMARNIIKRHGGKIGVDSLGPQKGSLFWFTIPIN